MLFVSSAEVTTAPEDYEGHNMAYANYVGKRRHRDVDGPQVFRVDMLSPNGTIRPHFHDVDQFQLFWRGGGRIGKDAVAPATFHYVDSYTPYGPIVGGDDGIGFFTIRAMPGGGTWYMPGSEKFRVRRSRRAGVVHSVDLARRESAALLGPHEDGVGAFRKCADAGEALTLSAPTMFGPQIAVVIDGELTHGGKAYPAWSVVSLAPGESAEVAAGANGVDVLALQFADQRAA